VRQAIKRAHEQADREFEAKQERAKRERERREAEERARAEAQAKRDAEIKAEREDAARKQAAEDKARVREDYILAGGDPDAFEEFWKIKGAEIVAERMRARMARVAHPRDYMSGGVPGGHIEPLTPMDR
jgi:hypothetical protein